MPQIMQVVSGHTFIMLLLAHLVVIADCAFDEEPTPQTVAVGEEAIFRCRHPSADTIRWKVDHHFVTANPPPDITPNTLREDGVIVYILTIIARSEYNSSIIECVAMFDDDTPDEQTFPVVLHVKASAIVGRFIEIPSSLNVSFGETAVFFCQYQNADHIRWNTTPNNRSDYFNRSSVGGRYKLSARVSEDTINYNATSIQCLAFLDDSPVQMTDPVTLLVQGRLDAVGNLKKNCTSVSWEPPFSLNLTYAEPDITYCVDIHNITCGRKDLIISDCSVTEPSYTFDDVAPNGYIYEYTVTPRSNVEGARNGTSLTVKDEFPVFNNWTLEYLWHSRLLLATHVDTALSLPVPTSVSLSLKPVDKKGHTHPLMLTADRNGSTIYFDLSYLPFRRRFTCTLLAYGCTDGSSSLVTFELSTHDIQDLSVVAINRRIIIRGHYIDHSAAEGLLVIMYNIGNPNSLQYHLISRRKGDTKRRRRNLNFELAGLGVGKVSVSFFVVERNGLPFLRAATRPRVVYLSNSSTDVPSLAPIEYTLQSDTNSVCINCTFKQNNSATGCLAVVHQRIPQLHSDGLMSIEVNWTQRFTRHGDTAFGCIPGLDLKLYQIGVADGREVSVVVTRDPPASDNTSVVVIAVISTCISILVLIVVMVIIIIKLVCIKRTRATVDCEAIEKVKLRAEHSTGKILNVYTDLPPATTANPDEDSGAMQADDPVDLLAYTSDLKIPSGIHEEQTKECGHVASCGGDGGGGKEGESSTQLSIESQTMNQVHDSSGAVSQEDYPSETSSGCDDETFCSCKPSEAVDQPVKTDADLDESIAGPHENVSLLKSKVTAFNMLCEQSEGPFLDGVTQKVDQPVTTQPLPRDNQKLDKEVTLPCRRRTSSLGMKRSCTQVSAALGLHRSNSLVLIRDRTKVKDPAGSDNGVKLKATDEIVTGRS